MLMSVGHSTHTAEQFGRILNNAKVDILVDVRSHPTSRWEQHRKEAYEDYLFRDYGVQYTWMPALGGWTAADMDRADEFARVGVDLAVYSKGKFPKQRIAADAKPEQTPAWTNQGLYDYSWYTSLHKFQQGVSELLRLSEEVNAAMMCCEGPWYKCHRSMIADCVVFRGGDVRHIPGHKMHSSAIGDRIARYDPNIVDVWRQYVSKGD